MKKTIIKIVVSILLFWYISTTVDIQSTITHLQKVNIIYIPLIIGLICLNYLVSSYRWKFLIEDKTKQEISIFYLIKLYFEGSFFNNFMPTSIGGDVYKVVALSKKINNKSVGFVSTFMERFTGVVALLTISVLGLTSFLGIIGILIFVGFFLSIFIGLFLLKYLAKKITKLQGIYDSLYAYKDSRGVLTMAIFSSFLVQILSIISQYLVFISLGYSVPFVYSVIFLPAITLATFFIPSLNGLGVQDALYISVFTQVGIPMEIALSASIIYHLLRLFTSLIGGVIYAISK